MQQVKTHVLLGVRTSLGNECLAKAIDSTGKEINIKDQEPFRKNEHFYSCQGTTGLCCRHALAKALLESWRVSFTVTGNGHLRHPMDLKSLVAYLITSVQKGSKGAKVTDFADYKGTFADETL